MRRKRAEGTASRVLAKARGTARKSLEFHTGQVGHLAF
jgi:hypothetical protein